MSMIVSKYENLSSLTEERLWLLHIGLLLVSKQISSFDLVQSEAEGERNIFLSPFLIGLNTCSRQLPDLTCFLGKEEIFQEGKLERV